MKATKSFIEQFEAPELSDLVKLSYGNVVRVKNGYENYEGVITKAPYFSCNHVCNYPENEEIGANGVWWVDINKKTYSLEDYNVIENRYNDHSITLIEVRS